MAARNMHRIEINIREKELCVKLVIYKDNINAIRLVQCTFPFLSLRICILMEGIKRLYTILYELSCRALYSLPARPAGCVFDAPGLPYYCSSKLRT